MSKGGVLLAVGVGVAVVVVGGVAMAATSSQPITRPNLAPPPPPPPQQTLGQALVGTAFNEGSKVYEGLTGTKLSAKTVAADIATGGIYSNAKAAVNVGKKILGSIF